MARQIVWWMGAVGLLGIFVSVYFHTELGLGACGALWISACVLDGAV